MASRSRATAMSEPARTETSSSPPTDPLQATHDLLAELGIKKDDVSADFYASHMLDALALLEQRRIAKALERIDKGLDVIAEYLR